MWLPLFPLNKYSESALWFELFHQKCFECLFCLNFYECKDKTKWNINENSNEPNSKSDKLELDS